MADLYYIDDGYYSPSEGYFVKIAIADAAVSSAVTVTVAIAKTVGVQSSVTATATVSADVQKIKGIAATLSSSATVSADANKLVNGQSAMSSAASITASVIRIQEAQSSLTSTATQTTSAVKSVSADSSLSSAFTQTAVIGRIKDFSATFSEAFTASMTVNAQKAGVALLEVVATFSSTPVANRATGSTLENIVNLSSQAVKTAVAESSVTSAFTTSAQVNRQTQADSSITSTASLSADTLSVQLATAALASTATLETSRYLGWGRPRNIASNANFAYSNSIYKFGTHSINLTSTVTNGIAYSDGTNQGNLVYGPNQSFVAETWIYPTSANYIGIIGVGLNQLANNHAWILYRSQTSPNNLYLDFYDINGNLITGNVSNTITNNQWNHILVVKVGQKASLFLDGVRKIALNDANLANEGLRTYDRFRLISNTGTYIDDASLHVGTDLGYSPDSSTITVPTARRENDHPYTRMIYRFDNNSNDDTAITQSASATLSATASLSGSITKTGGLSASLASTTTQSTSAVKTAVASATMASAASVTATIEKVQTAEASLSSAFTQTATVTRIRYGDSSQTSQATMVASPGTIKYGEISISSAFTPTLSVIAFKNYTAILDAVSTLTVSATTAVSAQATLTSTATQSVIIGRITQGALDANAFFNISTTPSKFSGPLINTTAQFTLTSTIGLRQSAESSLSSAATISTTITRQRPFASTQFSVATTQVSVINVYRNLGDQTFTSAFTQSASAARTRNLDTSMASAATVTADVAKRVGFVETFTAAFTQTAEVNRRVNPETSFASIATQLTAAFYNASGTVLLESTFAVSAIIGSIKPVSVGVNTGIRKITSGYATISAVNPPTGGLQITDAGFTISVWARRSNITTRLQPILASNTTSASVGWALALQNDDVYIRSNVDPDEQQIRWNNSIATDYLWHHIFVWGQPNHVSRPDGINRYWHLWVDGVYKGSTDFVQEGFAGDIDTGAPLRLGQADLRDLEASYALNGRQWEGDIGQVWVGQITSSNFQLNLPIPTTSSVSQSPDITEFYDQGFVNLGSGQGLFNELPQPVIFSQFETPYTGVTFVNTGEPGWTDATKPAVEPLKYGPQAQAQLTANALGVFLFESQISSQSTLTAQGQINFGGVVALSSQFTSNFAVNRRVAPAVNDMATVATISTVGVLAPAGGAALADHAATLACQAGYLRSQASAMSASASIAADSIVIPPISGDAQLSSQFAVSILAGKGNSYSANVTAHVTVTAEVTKIDPVRVEATISASASLTATVTRRRPGISIEQGVFTLATVATVIPPIRAQAELVSDFGTSATVTRLRQGLATVAATTTANFSVNKTARTSATITAQTTMVPEPNFRTGIAPTTLACEGFTLTAGDVINLDPALTLMITEETRLLRILPESRHLDIEQETRSYKLLKG